MSVRKLVFAGALLAVVPFAAVAQEKKAEPKAMPTPAAGAPATVAPAPAIVSSTNGNCGTPCPTGPATVRVCKMVPTQVQETRTVMKQVQKQETYTAHRYETVQEKKIVPVTTYKTVTETVMENRTKCVKVPCWEEKCVTEHRKKVEWVTEYKEKCRISFHKECKTIGGHGGLFGHCASKCDPCADPCADKCGPSLTIPVWKPCVTKECVPVCRPKCTTECVQVMKKVCTWKTEVKTECVPVCKTRCVPCTENKEVVCCKKVCVPYQATRCVTVCEPCTETVTVCKMVPTWVEEAAPACPTNACDTGCHDDCGHGHGLFRKCFGGCGLFSKFHGCFNFNLCCH
jgi:hypothetical protein